MFFKVFWKLHFKKLNFLTKTTRGLFWLLWIFKLSDSFDKQNQILQKSKSYERSSTDTYIDEDLEFIIHLFHWCIPLYHEIYTKCKKQYLSWLSSYI